MIMEIFYTKHADEKLKTEKFVPELKINKLVIKRAIQNSQLKVSEGMKIKAVQEIDKTHSLVVIYRQVEKGVRVITFFPAKKGRYEDEILSRR